MQKGYIIEKATPQDHILLTTLTNQSKSYWNYGPELMEKWSAVLTITRAYIEINSVYKISDNNKIVGYYSIIYYENGLAQLDNMFVHPSHIGKGIGKKLIVDLLSKVKAKGHKKILLEAEPFAEGFYRKMGFIVIDRLSSSIENRFLPIMEYNLEL